MQRKHKKEESKVLDIQYYSINTKKLKMTQVQSEMSSSSVSPRKKFEKRVRWSSDLTSVKIMTPEVDDDDRSSSSKHKFGLITIREEDEGQYLKILS